MTDPVPEVDLATIAARAVEVTDERELAQLRHAADEEIEAAVRSEDYRQRAVAFRAVGQMRFRAKTELLRRGLEDESPACRGSALLSLELLSRDHPRVVNQVRPLLHQLAPGDRHYELPSATMSTVENRQSTRGVRTGQARRGSGGSQQTGARRGKARGNAATPARAAATTPVATTAPTAGGMAAFSASARPGRRRR